MRLDLLNTLTKRVLFSFGISCLILIGLYFIYGQQYLNLFTVVIIALLTYVPVTIFYAVVSTFFVKDEKRQDDEVLDDV